MYTPLNPTFTVYIVPIFLIHVPKHRMWVPTINVFSKHIKIDQIFMGERFQY